MERQPLAGGLKKTVQYAHKQQPWLANYLLDARFQISNDLAENAIRPITVGSGDWLFSDAVKGTRASAVVYSLMETDKANGLPAIDYVLSNLPLMDFRRDPEQLKLLMPRSDYMRDCFDLNRMSRRLSSGRWHCQRLLFSVKSVVFL